MQSAEKRPEEETKTSHEKWAKFSINFAKRIEPGTVPNALANFQMLKGLAGVHDRKLRIVELGCGSGLFCKALLCLYGDLVEEYTLVDFSEVMIGLAKQNLSDDIAKGKHKLRFETLSVEKLEGIEDNYYDLAISNYCLHLVPDVNAAFKEASRVLKGNGYLTVSVLGNYKRSQRFKSLIEISLEMGLLSPTSSYFRIFRLGEVNALKELGEGLGFKAIHGHEFHDVSPLIKEDAIGLLSYIRPYFDPSTTDESLNTLGNAYYEQLEKESGDSHTLKTLGVFCIFQKHK